LDARRYRQPILVAGSPNMNCCVRPSGVDRYSRDAWKASVAEDRAKQGRHRGV